MTSKRYFNKWVKEAGRGHIIAFVGWTILLSYSLISIARLSMSTEVNFFGIASRELLWITQGLGILYAFVEFFYLLQEKKMDFYYCLPIKKSTIFWSRYIHGTIHFIIPLCLAMVICGLFQSTVDMVFFPYSASYTGMSILQFSFVFFIYYHIGILAVIICGNIISALLSCVVILFWGKVFVENILTVFAINFFDTYYKIPIFEKLDTILTPGLLSENITGNGLYNQNEVLTFIPEKIYIITTLGWIIITFLLCVLSEKKRKPERIGKFFMTSIGERVIGFVLVFLAGSCLGNFAVDILKGSEHGLVFAWGVFIVIGIFIAVAAHFLFERLNQVKNRFIKRKFQLLLECFAVVILGTIFYMEATPFNSYLPAGSDIEKIGISIDGLGMNHNYYSQIVDDGERYETDAQLKKYCLTHEGKTAALSWIASVIQENNLQLGDNGLSQEPYTYAVVCYYGKSGSEKYRIYPISQRLLYAFASVYETEEYKSIAYAAPDGDAVTEARFTWTDGVAESTLSIEDNEKKKIIDSYKRDIDNLKMEDLTEMLPIGFINIDSEMSFVSEELPVYSNFIYTCKILEEEGIEINKQLGDYDIETVEITDLSGQLQRQRAEKYEEAEEISRLKVNLIPVMLDLQPLLMPLDYSKEVDAKIWDETTNSSFTIECYMLTEKE